MHLPIVASREYPCRTGSCSPKRCAKTSRNFRKLRVDRLVPNPSQIKLPIRKTRRLPPAGVYQPGGIFGPMVVLKVLLLGVYRFRHRRLGKSAFGTHTQTQPSPGLSRLGRTPPCLFTFFVWLCQWGKIDFIAAAAAVSNACCSRVCFDEFCGHGGALES